MTRASATSAPTLTTTRPPSPPTHATTSPHHHPTTHPGARLPHAQLELDRQPVSALDLVGKGRFTLLATPAEGLSGRFVRMDRWRGFGRIRARR